MGFLDFLKSKPAPEDLRADFPQVSVELDRLRKDVVSAEQRALLVRAPARAKALAAGHGAPADGMAALTAAAKLLETDPLEAIVRGLELFETLDLKLKASALNVAGNGYFQLQRDAHAVECWALAIMMGMPRGDMQANLDEARTRLHLDKAVSDRDFVRAALIGRLMDQLVVGTEESGEAEQIYGMSLIRAEAFARLKVPQFGRPDLLRALEANPAKAVAQRRLLECARAFGDAGAAQLLETLPAVKLPAALEGRIYTLLGTFDDEATKHFAAVLTRL